MSLRYPLQSKTDSLVSLCGLAGLLGIFSLGAAAAAEPGSGRPAGSTRLSEEIILREIGRTPEQEENIADRAHRYLGTRADDLAIYLDSFFGTPQEDLESADSNVRLTARTDYDEDEGWEFKLRARGNWHLPRLSRRLSLVFNAEEDDFRTSYEPDEERNVAALQFRAYEEIHSRFDFTLGTSSGLNLRPGMRYRFKKSFTDHDRFRYTGRFEYSDKRRFHMINQLDYDYATGEASAIRFLGRLYNGQRSEGDEWGTAAVWRYGRNLDSAYMVALGVLGKTDPDIPEELEGTVDPALNGGSLVTDRGGWVLYRRRLYKDWLYMEVSPGYTWRKRHHYEDRHGVFFARLDFEINLNRGREARWQSGQKLAGRLGTGYRLPL